MRSFVWLLCLALLGALAPPLASTARARAPRYAVVNGGPADIDTAKQLLGLYGKLSPKAKPAPRPAARKPPPKAPARRAAARKRPRPTELTPIALSAPIRGRALRRALAGLPHDEAAALAAAALKRGKSLYATLKRDKAAEALTQAIALYDAHLRFSKVRKALVEAHTYLLLCHHALGQKGPAKKVAARLRELTANKRPAGVPAAVWQVYPLEPLALTPRRVITVKAPAKARVYLDDQLAGTGPLRLPVGPGTHRIRVEQPGHRVFTREVAGGAAAHTVVVSLVPQATDAFGDVRSELVKLRRAAKPWDTGPLRALAKRLFIDHLLVCVVSGGKVQARWFSTRLKKWASPVLTLSPRSVAAPVTAAFTQMVRAERKRDKALADIDKQNKGKKKSTPKLWKKWYFWVAAALVAGVVTAFAIRDSVTEEKVILRVTKP